MPRSPSRRAFAALTVSALAGCAGLSGDDPTNGSANESKLDESTLREHVQLNCTESIDSPDPYLDVRIEYDDSPEDADVSICAQPVEPFTDDSPAKIAVELTNVGDEEAEYQFGITAPYGGRLFAEQRQGEASLLIVPDDRTLIGPKDGIVPPEPTDDCWRALDGFGFGDAGIGASVAPGETIRAEYTILAAPESDCLVPGTYRSEKDAYDPIGREPWGFDIILS